MTAAALAVEGWSGQEALRAALEAGAGIPDAAGLDPVFDSAPWITAHAAAFGADDPPFGWTLRDGEAVVGVLALRREPRRGRLALRRARLSQDGTFDSDYVAPWIRPGRESEVLERWIEQAAAVPGLDALVLGPLPAASRALAALREVLERSALPRREVEVPCCAAPLQDDFDAYVASLKPRMRSKVRASLRGADELGARFAWCDDASGLADHLEGLFDLHQRRWEADGARGSFADPRRRRFYHAFAPAALARGELAFARLERAGRPVAYQLGLVARGRYVQLQEGYDPALAEARLGVALRARAVEGLIARGVRRYDFLAGVTRGKEDWGAETSACVLVSFPLPRLLPRLAYRARAWVERRRRTG